MNWQQLYSFVSKQAILGLCFEGIERLGKEYPEELKVNPIGRELLMIWMGKAQQIRRQNMRVNAVAGKLFSMLKEDGMRCCVLKGQGNALMYPNPYSRTPGDIDVWIDASRERIMEYAQKKFELGDNIRLQHLETSLDGVPVELHFFPCSMNNPIYHARLQKWFKRNADLQCSNVVSLPDGIGEIAIPTTAFNVVYQLTHLYHHFFDEGIGMRQIIDYYYVVCDFYKVYQNSSKTHPSSLTLKGGSTSTPSPSSSEGGDVTALRCSEPLCSKVGGPSKVSPDCLSASASKEALAGSTSSLNSTSDDIEVLVSVDLFSEGFDCPDVEFIQLARPTLSLAKYMQMVGRGLRVAKGKEYCVILDNVGLYKRFGLPSVDRDWQSMFEGRTSLEDILQEACMQVNSHNCRMDVLMNGDEDMMKIISHERQQRMIRDTYGYQIVEDEKGLKGIKDKDSKMILECQYKKIEVTNDGFAYCYIRKKVGRKEWIDLRNRLWFANKPQSVKLMGIDFCTEEGKKLYPRIQSKYIDEKTYLTVKTLELQVGTGLSWKHRFIPWDEPNKVYMYEAGEGNARLYIDEKEQYFAQKNIGSQLEKVDSHEELAEFAKRDKEEREEGLEKLKSSYKLYEYYPVDNFYPIKKYLGTAKDNIRIEKDGIWHVDDAQSNESFWVDPITHRKHYTRPVLFKRGYLNILKEGDWCYVRNIPGLMNRPLRQWEIVADDNICVINNTYLIEKSETDQWYKICRRTDDFTYFSVLACYYESELIMDDTEIQITQFDGDGLKMTQEGMPYTPIVIKTRKRSRWQ